MRLGLVADVHGNLRALQAVVAAGRRMGVDRWLSAGDVVGYGPRPDECVDVLGDLGAICVAGNHDLMAVGRLPLSSSDPLVVLSTRWTRDELRSDTAERLRSWPTCAAVDGVVVAHGSLDDPEEYVTGRAAELAQLDLLRARHPRSHTLVLGHTHRAAQVRRGSHRLVNPGSVGQSRQLEPLPLARFAVLDVAGEGRIGVQAVRVPFDVAGALADLHRRRLPLGALARRPRPVRRSLRSAAGRVRRLGRHG